MKRLLSLFVGIILLTGISFAGSGSISIGYGKAYDWTKGLSYNLQDTKTTASSNENGFKLVAHATPTVSKSWTDTTGWTEISAGGDTSISDNTLKQTTDASDGSITYVYRASFIPTPSNTQMVSSIYLKQSVSGANQTLNSAGGSGWEIQIYDGTELNITNLRSDGTNWDAWVQAGNPYYYNKTDMSQPVDTLYHLWEFKKTASDALTIICDGTTIATGIGTIRNLSAASGQVQLQTLNKTGDANLENYSKFLRVFNGTNAQYSITESTWESYTTAECFDAGSGNVWDRIDYTIVTVAGTNVTVEAKTAIDAASLSGATYFTVTSGVTWETANKNRWVQTRARMTSNGFVTPVLKDLSAFFNTAAGETNTTNFFRMW